MLKQSCAKTTNCGPDEICDSGYCAKLAQKTCRPENNTCDTAVDCCENLTCKDKVCTALPCPSCNDNNSCTSDLCDHTTGQCVYKNISSCCGNGLCEAGESCGNCAMDCGCSAGMVCDAGVCIGNIGSLLDSIDRNHTVNTCRQDALNEWKLHDYDASINRTDVCLADISRELGEIEALGNSRPLNQSQKEEVETRLLLLESKQEDMYFVRSMSKTSKKKDTLPLDQYDNFQYLNDLKESLSHLEMAMYDLYLIKKRYPARWDGSLEDSFSGYASEYQDNNQQINMLYDSIGSYDYKYAFQVDPDDPIVKEVVSELISNQSSDEVPTILLRYVYSSVKYVWDPNWQTDWVQPPVYTIMTGKGDCDDHAVLLASLFYRAGVTDSRLCFVDSNGDGERDHLTTAITQPAGYYMIYESTWNPEDYLAHEDNDTSSLSPMPISEYYYPATILYCFKPEAVMSYALASKCDDGTLYGECSYDKPWSCSNNGTYVLDCERCGCPEAYPYCANTGESRGECFACQGHWIERYAVCCPRGYPQYSPNTDKCYG